MESILFGNIITNDHRYDIHPLVARIGTRRQCTSCFGSFFESKKRCLGCMDVRSGGAGSGAGTSGGARVSCSAAIHILHSRLRRGLVRSGVLGPWERGGVGGLCTVLFLMTLVRAKICKRTGGPAVVIIPTGI